MQSLEASSPGVDVAHKTHSFNIHMVVQNGVGPEKNCLGLERI